MLSNFIALATVLTTVSGLVVQVAQVQSFDQASNSSHSLVRTHPSRRHRHSHSMLQGTCNSGTAYAIEVAAGGDQRWACTPEAQWW
ncbi:MAG: hypothetical protein F6K19_03220 [Cyanothece sp. SIO1E1]|nr:hypothetical protein [Cyanothece sp. SIO1E1]